MKNLADQGYPHYAVTYEGRVFSLRSYRFLKPSLNSGGYECVHIKDKILRVHRLVQQAFDPRDDYHDLFVNHIDGNRVNNIKSNLEWSNPKHNAIHAVRTGLTPTRSMDEPTIHMICQMLEDGLTSKEISEATGIDRIYINKINGGYTAEYISQEYDLTCKRSKRYTLDKITSVCEMLQEKRYLHKEIANMVGCEIDLVRGISARRRHKRVSANYDW